MDASLTTLHARATEWLRLDPDPETRRRTEAMLADDSESTEAVLRSCFGERLAFGTAGIRGKLGPGPGRMNRLLVRRVTAGLGEYLSGVVDEAHARGVVVAHDARRGSAQFAADVAAVLAGAGYRVVMCPPNSPTPLLAFAVLQLKAAAGVMVTASHNPAEYNGYKVYWDNGAQIISPHDAGIAAAIDALPMMRVSDGGAELIEDAPATLETEYLDAIYRQCAGVGSIRAHQLRRVVYSPLHGVGGALCEKALRDAGIDVLTVPSQRRPDGAFPTVDFPNPEEPGAMDEAAALADAEGINLVLVNDPDADRLAVMVRRPDTGRLHMLTGDELGAILGDALLERFTPDENRADRAFVATTIVSSELLSRVARHHGADCVETLTGFKWLWNMSLQRAERGDRFVFAYEEALGYAVGPRVRDKDGIGAALMTSKLAFSERGLLQRLEDIWRRHGCISTQLHTVVDAEAGGDERMAGLLSDLRRDPPHSIGDISVVRTRDLLAGAIGLEPTDCLTYWLSDGSRIIVRPSGTEPKLKIYFQVGDTYDATVHERAASRLLALKRSFLSVLHIP